MIYAITAKQNGKKVKLVFEKVIGKRLELRIQKEGLFSYRVLYNSQLDYSFDKPYANDYKGFMSEFQDLYQVRMNAMLVSIDTIDLVNAGIKLNPVYDEPFHQPTHSENKMNSIKHIYKPFSDKQHGGYYVPIIPSLQLLCQKRGYYPESVKEALLEMAERDDVVGEFGSPVLDHPDRVGIIQLSQISHSINVNSFTIHDDAVYALITPMGAMKDQLIRLLKEDGVGFGMRAITHMKLGASSPKLRIVTFDAIVK